LFSLFSYIASIVIIPAPTIQVILLSI